MTLWTYLFNLEEAELWSKDSTMVKKFTFTPLFSEKLIVEPESFKEGSCNRALLTVNNEWGFCNMDLLFFPIVKHHHWVLICINMFLKQVCYCNSVNAHVDDPWHRLAMNLFKNFSRACTGASIPIKDVSSFEWNYPKGYPYQSTTWDCGLFTMIYINSWNGKKMEMVFQPHMIVDYRKVVVADCLLSPSNEIDLNDVIAKHCNQ
ncbi:unnamed protein product [Urochloa humidicola]